MAGTDGTSTAERLRFVDTLRGFAIAGIVFVNTPDITRLGYDHPGVGLGAVDTALDFAVQSRFVPIFEVLFGASMWFIVRGARTRDVSPWPPMVLRMVALAGIGFLHSLVYPGEILLSYAVCGLAMLPLVLLTPRWVPLVLGAGSTAAVMVFLGGSAVETPGLLLLGAAAAAYGVPERLERAGGPVVAVFAGAVLLAIPALWWQTLHPGDPRFVAAGGRAGFVLAVAYVTGLALLWRTPARRVLAAAFERSAGWR